MDEIEAVVVGLHGLPQDLPIRIKDAFAALERAGYLSVLREDEDPAACLEEKRTM